MCRPSGPQLGSWFLARLVQAFSRRAAGDDELGPYRMPAGAHIVISPYALHRRPDYWPEPDAFWPERFAPGARTDRPKLAYLPFGGGPRICIGMAFAMIEATAMLAGDERGPKRDALLLNAGAAFFVVGRTRSIGEGWELAAQVIDCGKAEAKLRELTAR